MKEAMHFNGSTFCYHYQHSNISELMSASIAGLTKKMGNIFKVCFSSKASVDSKPNKSPTENKDLHG